MKALGHARVDRRDADRDRDRLRIARLAGISVLSAGATWIVHEVTLGDVNAAAWNFEGPPDWAEVSVLLFLLAPVAVFLATHKRESIPRYVIGGALIPLLALATRARKRREPACAVGRARGLRQIHDAISRRTSVRHIRPGSIRPQRRRVRERPHERSQRERGQRWAVLSSDRGARWSGRDHSTSSIGRERPAITPRTITRERVPLVCIGSM